MICLVVLQTILFATICYAIPAKRLFFKVKLEDGTSIMVTQCGDESFHYLADEKGTPVVMVADSTYRLAPELKDEYSQRWTERAKTRNAHRLARSRKVAAQNRQRREFGHPSVFEGKKKGVVILVNFTDKKFQAKNNHAAFDEQFNLVGYSKNNHVGSVHDYFYDQSYGKFDVKFDVFGPVNLVRSYSFYGKNDSNGDDKYPAVLVEEACKLADIDYDINWSDYDWDGDGFVDQVYIVYAGSGEHASYESNLIWPHESSMEMEQDYGDGNGPFAMGETMIDTYAMSCELSGGAGSMMDGIGTACHEFGHCFGIPDFYNIDYSGGHGMGPWDLMDSGSYNGKTGHAETPAGFTAYERWFAGWLQLQELAEPCYVKNMPSLQDEPCAYIIYNEGNSNEYFILENRQSNKWFKYVDTSVGIHGLFAYHVDYDAESWEENEVNLSKKHQRMSYIPAGKSYYDHYSQLFPGWDNITELTNTSHETYNAKLFNTNKDGSFYMNKPITNIEEDGGLISFSFMGGEEETAISEVAENAEDNEYFMLNGIKTSDPTKPGLYLVKKGDKVLRKLIVR